MRSWNRFKRNPTSSIVQLCSKWLHNHHLQSNPDAALRCLDEEYVVDLFGAGISGYVLKEDHIAELVMAINAVRNGSSYFSGVIKKIIQEHVRNLERGRNGPRDSFRDLSLREREVFQLLCEGNTIKDIAKKLSISPKTVESHKYNLMEKLNASTMADLTRIAIKKKVLHP